MYWLVAVIVASKFIYFLIFTEEPSGTRDKIRRTRRAAFVK